ncbi:hypothetical protein [uncultured Draconibacterium sp.]|uniref:hypothetical protein n=1 Tax=uncultured Draconibacterium sp. TaxID=1573823 RepID=UPI0025FDBE8A|nr:hypothetical protein [uncultured Draconibacterium sp.]
MKKLVFLLTAVIAIAFSSSVFAQSTGTNPAPGATHSYFITPGNSSNTITWTVYEDDFETVASEASVVTVTSDSVNITWASTVTPNTWYYVQVVESEGDCSNTKVLPVQIKESDFTLTLAATYATACYDNAVSVSIVNNSPEYYHGTADLEFTVSPGEELQASSYSGYQFDLSLTVPAGFSADTTFSSNVSSFDGTTVFVSDNNDVTISFLVDNENTYDNESLPNAQDFTATVEILNGKTVNGVSENNTDDDNSDSTDVSRPNTSGIGTN